MKTIVKVKTSKLLFAIIATMILVNGANVLKAEKPSYGAQQKKKNQEQSAKAVKKPRKFRLFPGSKPKKIQTKAKESVAVRSRRLNQKRPNSNKVRQVQHTTSGNGNITRELELLYQQEGRTMPNEMNQRYQLAEPDLGNNYSGSQANPNQRGAQNSSRNMKKRPKRKTSFFKRLFTRKSRNKSRPAQNNSPRSQKRRRGVQQAAAQPRQGNSTRVQQTQGRRSQGGYIPPVAKTRVNPVKVTLLPALPLPEEIDVVQRRQVVHKQPEVELPPVKTVQEPKENNFFEVAEDVNDDVEESLEIPDVPQEKLVEKFTGEEVGTAIVKREKKTTKNISEKLNRGEFDNPFTEVSEEEADEIFAKGDNVSEDTIVKEEEASPVANASEDKESPFSGLTLTQEESEIDLEKAIDSEIQQAEQVNEEKYDNSLDISSDLKEIKIKPLAKKAIQSAKPIKIQKIHVGLDGNCPVSLRNNRKLVKANNAYRSRYQSVVYHFSSHEAKVKFDENPHFYAPVEGGVDVTLLETEKQNVKGSLEHGAWYQGRLYLFSSSENKDLFTGNPAKYTENLF